MTIPAASQTELIESSQINGLIEAAGVDGAREIFKAFWRSSDDLLALLDTHLYERNFSDAARAAHALKGSAANVGAQMLADEMRALETACRDQSSATAGRTLERAKALYADTTLALKSHLRLEP